MHIISINKNSLPIINSPKKTGNEKKNRNKIIVNGKEKNNAFIKIDVIYNTDANIFTSNTSSKFNNLPSTAYRTFHYLLKK